MNPQHAIPTMKEGDFVMSESKAIAAYVASKYDKSGRLYPKDPVVRGRVDQRVYFHEGTFYPRAGEVMVSRKIVTKFGSMFKTHIKRQVYRN